MFGLSTKEERALRSGLSALLCVPPLVMMFLDYPHDWGSTWPLHWQVGFFVFCGLSLAIGWEPAKKSWTGEDHHLYVDEPEIDDDWEG